MIHLSSRRQAAAFVFAFALQVVDVVVVVVVVVAAAPADAFAPPNNGIVAVGGGATPGCRSTTDDDPRSSGRRHHRRFPTTTTTAVEASAKKKNASSTANNGGGAKSNGNAGGGGFARRGIESPRRAIEADVGGGAPAHADLVEWVRRNPESRVSSKFSILPSALGGHGGFASSSLREGELILRIPRSGCCVTQDDAVNDPRSCGPGFRSIRDDPRIPGRGMVLIAGWIAAERMVDRAATRRRRRGRRHEGGDDGIDDVIDDDGIDGGGGAGEGRMPYLQTLPWERGGPSGQDHVLFWSDEEVRTLLGGSRAFDDAMLVRRTVDDAVELLRGVVMPVVRDALAARGSGSGRMRDHGDGSVDDDDDAVGDDDVVCDDSDPDEWLDAAVRGAFVIALSRSFAEEVEYDDHVDGGETRVEVENVLLPLIDVLQHSNDPNTTLEPFDDCVVLRARRDVAAGEELFHCYREENDDVIPPHKFFTRYGFVPGAREPIPELLKRRSRLFFDS